MDQDRFEAEVVFLAAEGVALTVANVAARMHLGLREVEPMLDAMVTRQCLDIEIDEARGIVVYSPPRFANGLRVKQSAAHATRLRTAAARRDGGCHLSPRGRPVRRRPYPWSRAETSIPIATLVWSALG